MKTRKGHKIRPLTSAQELHFYCLKYCPKKQVLNISSSLIIWVDLDWDALKDCIQEAIARCDTMRLRFTHGKGGNVYQYMVKEEIGEVEHFDLTSREGEDVEGRFQEWTEVLFEQHDPPIHHIVVIRMPDRYQGLYIYVSHTAMDVQSLILSPRGVTELYVSKLYDEVDHPEEASPYIKQLERDLACGIGSKACEKDGQSSQELIASSEPILTDTYSLKKLPDEGKTTRSPKLRVTINTFDNVKANITSFHPEGDSSGHLLDFCEKRSISMTCLPLMGL